LFAILLAVSGSRRSSATVLEVILTHPDTTTVGVAVLGGTEKVEIGDVVDEMTTLPTMTHWLPTQLREYPEGNVGCVAGHPTGVGAVVGAFGDD
jgi:hypothetical protein